MSNEDFGHMIEQEKKKTSSSFNKKPLKIAVLVISLAFFILLTISAYNFTQKSEHGIVKTVKSPTFKLKTRDQNSNNKIKNIDKTIYENISNRKDSDDDIKIVKPPKAAEVRKSKKPILTPSNKTPPIPTTEIAKSNIVVKDNKVVFLDDKAKKAEGKKEVVKSAPKKVVVPEKMNLISTKDKIQKPYSRVQLVASRSDVLAHQYWLKLKKDYPDLFGKLKHFIQKADLGKRGVFYRLQVGNFRNQIRAEEFCKKFIKKTKKTRSDCLIVE